MLRKVPLIVILGSTATGKTKLSVELAQRFRGEIISADSMQIYKGLDISTAKATKAEQSQAVHHLLDVCDPVTPTGSSYRSYTVVDFRDSALPIIHRLFREEKMPIIVGGTNYYIESVLWKVLVKPPLVVRDEGESSPKRRRRKAAEDEEHVLSNAESAQSVPGEPQSATVQEREANKLDAFFQTVPADLTKDVVLEALQNMRPHELKGRDNEFLHCLLSHVDPVTAEGLHPNNQRKVRRALEVFMEEGTRMSDVIASQRDEEGSSYLGGPLRFPHVILFWIKSDQDVLNARIDKRIDGMVAEGLLHEIRKFYNMLVSQQQTAATAPSDSTTLDCTQGMLQAIGFKEFVPYLEKYRNETLDTEITDYMRAGGSSKSPGDKPDGIELVEQCLDDLRLRTKRYSKTQIKWVTNRFVSSKGRHVPPVYILDSTNAATNWREDVFLPAEHVVESYLADRVVNVKAAEQRQNPRDGLNENVTHFCADCGRRFIGDYQWNLHLKSNKHRRVKASKAKREKMLNESKKADCSENANKKNDMNSE